MTSSFIFRTRIILFCIISFGFILIAKLFLVQVVYSNTYAEKAEHQYATPSGDIYERGTIYFSRKDGQLVSAATQISGYKLAIDPPKIVDPELAYKKLSNIVSIDREDFLARALKKNDPYEEIIRPLNKEEADALSSLKIAGVKIF